MKKDIFTTTAFVEGGTERLNEVAENLGIVSAYAARINGGAVNIDDVSTQAITDSVELWLNRRVDIEDLNVQFLPFAARRKKPSGLYCMYGTVWVGDDKDDQDIFDGLFSIPPEYDYHSWQDKLALVQQIGSDTVKASVAPQIGTSSIYFLGVATIPERVRRANEYFGIANVQ